MEIYKISKNLMIVTHMFQMITVIYWMERFIYKINLKVEFIMIIKIKLMAICKWKEKPLMLIFIKIILKLHFINMEIKMNNKHYIFQKTNGICQEDFKKNIKTNHYSKNKIN